MTTHSPARHAPFTPRTVAAITGILLVGALLRLHALDSESAWLDEAFAIRIARAGLDEILLETRLDVHPPLYYIVLSGWLALTGGSVWSARLLSVVFSLLTLVATHVAGTRLAGRTAGLAAASLLAVSVFQIEFAQEARMYTQLTLLATLSMLGFIRLFERRHLGWFMIYVVTTALMTWTHVYAAFIIAARFIPFGRVAVNLSAGALAFPRRRFIIIDAIAVSIWATYGVLIGITAAEIFENNLLVSILVGVAGGIALGWIVDKILAFFGVSVPEASEAAEPNSAE